MPEEPGQELAISKAGLEELEDEPYRVKTSPLEVTYPFTGAGEVPDWVMVGLPGPFEMVRLFASRTLTRAELHRKIVGYHLVPITPNPKGPTARVPHEVKTVVATMDDFTQITAASYPEALRELLEQWER